MIQGLGQLKVIEVPVIRITTKLITSLTMVRTFQWGYKCTLK